MTETNVVDIGAAPPLTQWKKEPTLMELRQDYEDARSYHDAKTGQIQEWLDNLHVRGKAKINTAEGTSKIVPKLIRKQAEWRYAALSEPFLSTKDVFNVSPVSWEDREAARQNQLVLNHQFNTKLKKVHFIDNYVRTAVNEGTVIVKVGWDYQEEVVVEQVPYYTLQQQPEALGTLQNLHALQQQDPERFAREVPQEMQQALQASLQSGAPLMPVQAGTQPRQKTRVLRNQPTLEICKFTDVVIDPTCKGDIDKAGFIIYRFEASLSMLKEDGRYRNLDRIHLEANSILGEPDYASSTAQTFNFADQARKKFVVHEYWGYRDIDGSGRVRPIVAAWVGNTLIRMQENPFPDGKLPFVAVQYLPVTDDTYGEPDGALLDDNQKIIGAVTRGMIDIMGRSANGQMGVRKDALDITNKRRFDQGKDYEFNANVDPRQAFYMHTYPEIPASAQFMLQLQNLEAEALTGVKSFNQGIGSQSLGDVAAGIRGALDAASKRELGLLRRLSQGLVTIGRKIIAMNALFLSDVEVVRITNEEFVEVRRDDLQGDFDLELSISTAEEDNQKAQELAFMLQTMGNNMDAQMSKMILSDIARLRKMPDLAKRIEDYEPQPDPLMQRKMELEIAVMESELEKNRALAEQALANARLSLSKIGTEQAKAENLESQTDQNNLNFVEQESGVTQQRELQKQGEQARAQAGIKVLEHRMKAKEKSGKD